MIVYTVGHSTREWDDFVALLARDGVRHIADVRRFPGSRRHPHFSSDAMRRALPEAGIAYTHLPELGGRRRPRPDSPNAQWRNESFRGYADYMETPEFRAALDALLDIARRDSTAVMCAEAVPWRCHRSLIADALIARAVEVLDILDARTAPHPLTRFARIVGDEVRYDAPEAPRAQPDLFADAAGAG